MRGLWWDNRHWGRFFPSTSVSLANHHSTNFSVIIITQGWHNRPIGGRSAEWTNWTPRPPPQYNNLKINLIIGIALLSYLKSEVFGILESEIYIKLNGEQ
jgi:hypothetical protein